MYFERTEVAKSSPQNRCPQRLLPPTRRRHARTAAINGKLNGARQHSAASVAVEFLEHASQEMVHADSLAKRIVELRGEPNFSPSGLAERIAIESYREMIGFVGDRDPTSQRMLKEILAR